MMPATPQQAEKKAEVAAEQAKRRGASPGQVEAIKLETYARERGAVVEPVTTTADGRSTSVTLRGEEHTGFRLSNGKDTALIDYSAGLDAVSDFLGDSPARALGMQYAAQVMTIQQKSQQAFDDGYNRGFVSSVRSGVRAQQQQQLQTARQLDAQSLQKWQADQARAKMTTLEKVQLGLDVTGMTEIPIVSQLAELGSAGISLYNGDYVGAGLGVASMLPIAGKWAEAAKVERLTERMKVYSDAIPTSPSKVFKPEMVDSYLDVRFAELTSSGRPKTFMLGEGQRDVARAAKANNNAVQILEIWPDNMKFMDAYDPLTNRVKPGFESMHQMSVDFNKHVIRRLVNEGYEFKTIGTRAPDRLTVSSDWYRAELEVLKELGVKPKQISWARTGK